MALKYTLDSVEELPEPVREHYREDNGKFVLDVDGAKSVAEVEKMNKALESERKVSKQFKDAAHVWENSFPGKTPEQLAALLERIPILEAESTGKIDQKKFDSILETTVKQRMTPLEHEINKQKSAVAERDVQIAAYQAADRRRTIHDAVRAVAAREGFQESTYSNTEGALMLLADRNFTINSIGQVVVTDDNQIYTPGLPLTEALGQIKQHHGYMLKQSLGGGAAGTTGIPGVSGANPFMANNMTLRGKFMNEHPDKWQKAMEKAGLASPMDQYKAAK